MITVFRNVALIVALMAACHAAGAEPSRGGAPAIVPCDKNHYILDEPCGMPAIEVAIGPVGAVTVDAKGNVYFSGPNIVFRLDAAGFLTRVAGNGERGFGGDGGPAVEARLDSPYFSYPEMEGDDVDFSELLGPLAVDPGGNLYIADAYNNRIRKIDTDGIITTIAGGGGNPTSGDSSALNQRFWWPQGVATDVAGNVYVSDYGRGILTRITPAGTAANLAIKSSCRFYTANWAYFCGPQGIAIDAQGNLFVAESDYVRRVDHEGNVTTVAGHFWTAPNGNLLDWGYSGDGGPATSAVINGPFSVAVDLDGNLFIADTYNHCIRRVDATGMIATVAGVCSNYWTNNFSRGFRGDGGPATDAYLDLPHGVAVDNAGNLYIADSGNNRLRKVSRDGVITTIAGNGGDLPR